MPLPRGRVRVLTLLVFLFAVGDKTSQVVARKPTTVDTNSTMDDINSTIFTLLKGYDSRIRPGARTGPIEVLVDMFVANIWAMEEVKMEFTIDLYLRQYWRDERLTHNYHGPLTLSSGANKQLWLPSTYFLRAKLAYFHDVTTDNYLLQIQPDGSIFYSVRKQSVLPRNYNTTINKMNRLGCRCVKAADAVKDRKLSFRASVLRWSKLTITVACNLDLRKFPHDTQTCSLALESYGYPSTDVGYSWNTRKDNTSVIVVDSSVQLPQFNLFSVEKEAIVNEYNIGNHSSLVAKFQLKRRIGYYLIDTYIPSTIIVVISWISFWIDPDTASARVALGITTVLTMTTLISSARAALPKVSYVKAIDWYLLLCLIFVFGSILEYTFVTFTKSLHVGYKKRMAAQIERNSNGEAGNCILKEQTTTDQESELVPKCSFRRNNNVRRAMAERMSSEAEPLKRADSVKEPTIKAWLLLRDPLIVDKVSRLGFPLAFFGFNCIYWLVYSA